MEIFWQTIAHYNSWSWIYQLIIVGIGILLSVLLFYRPRTWVKNSMKCYLAGVYLWLSIAYYYFDCGIRAYNGVMALIWALLALVCAVGICKGAVGMVHLYSPAVQQRCVKLGLTTHEKIKRNSQLFKAVCIPGYIGYVLVCVYGINGAKGFAAGFWQLLVILSVMNLIDRFLIDGYWVGHTNAWTIPGTEDLKPYITAKDKQKKWLFGTVGMAGIAAVLAVLMTAFIH